MAEDKKKEIAVIEITEGKPYKRKYTPNKKNNLGYGIQGEI